MAEEERPAKEDDESPEGAKPSKLAGLMNLKKFVSKKMLVSLVIAALVSHSAFLMLQKNKEDSSSAAGSAEVSLGNFHFIADTSEKSKIAQAKFLLRVRLLTEVDDLARVRLVERKFKVQQNVEELLRQSHGGDFTDPRLSELKRQIQEQINETIAVRAIEDVIITDLDLDMAEELPEETTESAVSAVSTTEENAPIED